MKTYPFGNLFHYAELHYPLRPLAFPKPSIEDPAQFYAACTLYRASIYIWTVYKYIYTYSHQYQYMYICFILSIIMIMINMIIIIIVAVTMISISIWYHIHPSSFTWNLNISPWKGRLRTWNPSFLRFQGGCIMVYPYILQPSLSAIGFFQFLLQLIISNDQGTELVEVPMQHSLSFEGSAWMTGGPGKGRQIPTVKFPWEIHESTWRSSYEPRKN